MKKLILFLCFFVWGCTSFQEQFDKQALIKLKNQPAERVVDTLGNPDQTEHVGDETRLIYKTRYKTYTPSPSDVYLGRQNNQGQYQVFECYLAFIIKNNIVQNVISSGNCF